MEDSLQDPPNQKKQVTEQKALAEKMQHHFGVTRWFKSTGWEDPSRITVLINCLIGCVTFYIVLSICQLGAAQNIIPVDFKRNFIHEVYVIQEILAIVYWSLQSELSSIIWAQCL